MGNARQVIPFDSFNLLLCWLVTVGQQASFFCIAYLCQFDKVTDFAGGTNFLVLQWIVFWVNGMYSLRHVMILILTSLWSLRLAGYLFYRIIRIGVDERFNDRRENFVAFLIFWIYQAFWVFVVSLPALFIAGSDDSGLDRYTWVDVLAWILFLIGLIIEAVSDQQKFNFRMDPANKGKFCAVGFWAISRHPNYFGEILIWWSVFLAGVPIYHLTPSTWVGVLSPIMITLLLVFVSGIPILEKSADKRYGNDPAYQTYKARTPILVPFIPSLFAQCSPGAKSALCCEWEFFAGEPESQPIKGSDSQSKSRKSNSSGTQSSTSATKTESP